MVPLLLVGSWVTTGAAALAQGGLAIGPTRVTLDADRRSQALTVTNEREEPVLMQAQALLWEAVEGEMVKTPSTDLIISPPMFEIEPGGEQTIRVGIRDTIPVDGERAYRLLIAETPPDVTMGTGIRFAFQFDLPVFVIPKGGVDAELTWKLELGEDEQWQLAAANSGNGHVQVRSVRIDDGFGGSVVVYHPVYLLPGAEYRWEVDLDGLADLPKGGRLTLGIETDLGPLAAGVAKPGVGAILETF